MLRLVSGWLLAVSLVLFATVPVTGQDLVYAAVQLSAKISVHGSAGSASLSVTNRSSFNNQTVSLIRAELLRGLQSHGWKFDRPQQNEASIAITLAETYRNYVWTAQVMKAGSPEVSIVELPKSTESAQRQGDRVVLSRFGLISSDNPLLDVALLEGRIGEGAHLLALSPTTIQVYQMQSTQWRLLQTQPLASGPRATRDLRGRIAPGQSSSFDAYLPALHCAGVLTNSLTVTCRSSDDPWPLSDDRRLLAFYAVNRNYFNGVISGPSAQSGNVEPFFSAAIVADHIVYANVDGLISVALPGRNPSAVPESWGSSIAAIQGCQSDLVVVSAASDFHHGDELTAFHIGSSDFSAASEPVAFDGPVLNLKSLADHQEAIAIVASPSGRYEAYLLTARCGA